MPARTNATLRADSAKTSSQKHVSRVNTSGAERQTRSSTAPEKANSTSSQAGADPAEPIESPQLPSEDDTAPHDRSTLYTLRIAIDYGTVSLAAAFHVRGGASSNQAPNIRAIDFCGNHWAPMQLYWDESDERLCWGHEVATKVSQGDLDEAQTITVPKLALYRDFGEEKGKIYTDRLNRQLKNIKTKRGLKRYFVDDLIKEHPEAVFEHIMHQISVSLEAQDLQDREVDIMKIKRLVYLSVPQAWNPSSNEIMEWIAEELNWKGALVSEPQCVAAYTMHQDLQRKTTFDDGWIAANVTHPRQMVIDAGGGTVDIAKFEMLTPPSAKCKLRTIEQEGKLLGSALINEDFVDHLVQELQKTPPKDYESFEDLLEDLEIDEDNFRSQASHGFEYYKRLYHTIPAFQNTITIKGTDGSSEPYHHYMSKNQIGRFVEKHVAAIVQFVESLEEEQVQSFTLSGGFGKSELLKKALEKKFRPRPVHQCGAPVGDFSSLAAPESYPVSFGALLRQEVIDVEASPSQYCYFTVADDNYDEKKHTDVKKHPGRLQNCHFTNEQIVRDRVVVLAKKGEISDDQQQTSFVKFTWWLMYKDNLGVGAKIYWSANDVPEDYALKDVKKIAHYSELRSAELSLQATDLTKLGYRPISSHQARQDSQKSHRRQARDAYLVGGRVVMTIGDTGMSFGFQIARANKFKEVQRSEVIDDEGKTSRLFPMKRLWKSNFSHVPRGTEPLQFEKSPNADDDDDGDSDQDEDGSGGLDQGLAPNGNDHMPPGDGNGHESDVESHESDLSDGVRKDLTEAEKDMMQETIHNDHRKDLGDAGQDVDVGSSDQWQGLGVVEHGEKDDQHTRRHVRKTSSDSKVDDEGQEHSAISEKFGAPAEDGHRSLKPESKKEQGPFKRHLDKLLDNRIILRTPGESIRLSELIRAIELKFGDVCFQKEAHEFLMRGVAKNKIKYDSTMQTLRRRVVGDNSDDDVESTTAERSSRRGTSLDVDAFYPGGTLDAGESGRDSAARPEAKEKASWLSTTD